MASCVKCFEWSVRVVSSCTEYHYSSCQRQTVSIKVSIWATNIKLLISTSFILIYNNNDYICISMSNEYNNIWQKST